MKYNVKATLKKVKTLKGNPVKRTIVKKNSFNANLFLQNCNKRRKLKKGTAKTLKDLVTLMNFELQS